MAFDDLGAEKIKFGSELKLFEDPDSSISNWLSGKFAIADEESGVLITPYHAAVGRRKHEAEEENEMVVRSTDKEHSAYNVTHWVRGVFEMPTDYELVNLSHAKHLVTGGERSEWPVRVEEYYKHSREPYNDGTSLIRVLLPVVAFLGTFGGMYLIADQLSRPNSAVSYGLLLFAASLKQVDWKRVAKALVALLVPTVAIVGLAAATNVVLTLLVVVTLLLGFSIMPIVTVLARASDRLSGVLGSLYLKLGLMGYENPIWRYGPKGYTLHEYSELDTTASVSWYNLSGSTVGFTFEPNPEMYPESIDAEELKDKSEIATDGAGTSNIPSSYVRSEEFDRAKYGGFVPKRPNSSSWYVASGRALKRLAGAAEGEKSQKRLEWAKEAYGVGGWQVSDKTLALLVFGSMLVAVALGTFVFFL